MSVECYVYKLENTMNSKIYIGISNDPQYRFSNGHKNSNYPIGKAIKKYGIENFSLSILFEGTRSECVDKEIELIESYDSRNKAKGYNIAPGGEYPPSHSGKDHYGYGKKRSPETIQKIKDKRKLQIITEETKQKMSEKMLGNTKQLRSITSNIARQIWILRFSKSASEVASIFKTNSDLVRYIWNGDRYKEVQIDANFDDGIDTTDWLSIPYKWRLRICKIHIPTKNSKMVRKIPANHT